MANLFVITKMQLNDLKMVGKMRKKFQQRKQLNSKIHIHLPMILSWKSKSRDFLLQKFRLFRIDTKSLNGITTVSILKKYQHYQVYRLYRVI